MEKPTEPVQEVVYENGVMEDKTGKEDDTVDSSKIPESLTTVNLGPEEVNAVPPITDADMDRGDNAGMDIDEVMGWKDDITAHSEANAEQKMPEPSSESVLVEHQEENSKSREPIVYGRRAHVEVPLYDSLDVDQKLPKPSSPVSEDENLKIETDSEQEDDDDDDDNESMQEDDQKVIKQKTRLYENGNLFSLHQLSYFKPPETEGDFLVSDLVWGKVRSHPWWPGQIIDPSGASKKAMKYYKKDSLLVAYFGDHSFAWNSPSVLTPFRTNFSQYANQTNTEIFKTAVSCALDEVSRRVELGLACSCTPKEIYKKIEYQVTENGGVTKKSSKIHGKDESAHVNSFEPDKLVDYVRLLAQFPDQGDKLDLAIAKAQLTSYGRYKGHRELTEFLVCGDMFEEQEVPVNEPVKPVAQVNKNGEKIESDLIDLVNPNKEISLSDITDDAPAPAPVTASESVGGTSKLVSSSGLKKRKARVSVSNGSVKKQGRVSNKVSTAPVSTPTPKPTPTPTPKPDPKVDHGQQVDQTVQTPENSQVEASVADMLSQLHLTAQDPMKEHGFFQTIIPFFYERRAAVFSKSLKKPPTVETPDEDLKLKPPNENEPEEFEFDFDFDFDDVNDSYWTDRIIQNHSEDQPMQDNQDDQNGAAEESQIVEHETEKPAKRRRQLNKKEKLNKKERPNKKGKRAASSNHKPEPEPEPVPEEPEIVRKRRENLATEVVLKFEEGINFRSEAQLNKMFWRFGPLMESETEVDRAGGRARVVFKKCSDAEVAHNSAGQFNIFGSVNVSYELNYSPLVSYKPLPLSLPVLQEDLQPVLQQDPLPVIQEDPLQIQEDAIPMSQEDLHPMLQEEPSQVLQEEPLPVLQENAVPVLQEDPQPVLQEELPPVLQENVVPVLQEDPRPVLQEDPVLVLQEEPAPVLQENAVPVLQEDQHAVLQGDPQPILQEDPVRVLQDDPMDAS
ncbi:PWWP domain-containing protein 5-like [Bidens hawaiensis]|uniref:PWWP domain-containing protein 5-like n=1 Tax=Bidens hawaiensis TaxID=980011 RepID=UPI0040490E2B